MDLRNNRKIMNYPRISIVIPSFNQGQYLERTILSVIDQNYPNPELIIIDGGSTDNSVEIIKKYEKHLTYWISEKDKGQSHAINKGLAKCTGAIFNWLCSDDYLEPGSLLHIGEAFQKGQNIHCYSGKLRQFSASGTVGYYGNMLMSSWEDTLRVRVLKQPAVFFSTEAINKMGPLNEDLHYCMDAEWLYRFLFLFRQENIAEDDFLIAHCLLHQDSKSASQVPGFIIENDSIMHFFSKSKDLGEYAELLELNQLNKSYVFPERILKEVDAKLVERMVFFYLLRRSVKIFTRKDFEFAKRFLSINHPVKDFRPDEQKMLDFLNRFVKNSSWFSFRIKRAYLWRIKNKHLDLEME